MSGNKPVQAGSCELNVHANTFSDHAAINAMNGFFQTSRKRFNVFIVSFCLFLCLTFSLLSDGPKPRPDFTQNSLFVGGKFDDLVSKCLKPTVKSYGT